HVDKHGSALHMTQHITRDELWGACSCDQHRADHHVGTEHLGLDDVYGRGERPYAALEQLVELPQPRQRPIDYRDLCAKTSCHASRVRAAHAAAKPHNFGGTNAGTAAHEPAAPAGRPP